MPRARLPSQLGDSLLFRGVNLDDIADLLGNCTLRRLKQGEVLIHAGEPNEFVYLILSGRLRVHFKSLELKPVDVLGAGDIAGILSFIDGHPASAHVVADESSLLLVLDESTVWSLVERSPLTARNMLWVLSQRLRHGHSVMEASLVEKVAERHPEELRKETSSVGHAVSAKEPVNSSLELYERAETFVSQTLESIRKDRAPDLEQATRLADEIAESLSQNHSLLFLATDRKQAFSIETHSVNATILSLRIADTLKYKSDRKRKIAVAGLLHEIGTVSLPDSILYQDRPSPQLHQRPVYGAAILEKLCPEFDWLIELVGQVFEREDGSGPRGLKGNEIREDIKVLGIADAFDASIHDRPYRKAITGYQLVHELTRSGAVKFSGQIVKALVKSFSLYPYNEYVLLNSNELGQVVGVHPENPLRPVVRILYSSEGEPLKKAKMVDLTKNPSMFVVRAVSYHRLPLAIPPGPQGRLRREKA